MLGTAELEVFAEGVGFVVKTADVNITVRYNRGGRHNVSGCETPFQSTHQSI
jgi:hypothetical protein